MNDQTPANNYPIHDLASLEVALHQLIPVSAFMGIRPIYYDGKCLRLTAPLKNNVNHQLSAFGGSLFSVSVLAGWSILQLKVAELGIEANTVIAGGELGYAAPVFEDIHCELNLPDEYDGFSERLMTKGKASIQLTSNVRLASDRTDSEPLNAMNFSGKYVVRRIVSS